MVFSSCGRMNKINNTTWDFNLDEGESYRVTFESDGTFYYNQDGNPDIETWEMIDNKSVRISFNSGYMIMEGYLVSNNYMIGNWISKNGTDGDFSGTKINN